MADNRKLAEAFATNPGEYPTQLAARFPRVLDEIAKRWQTTELDSYFPQLLLSDRADRQGFPPEVMAEIFMLYNKHEAWKDRRAVGKDIWGDERLLKEFRERGLEFTPRGFFRALESGDEAALRLFIEAGVDVELTNAVGWTPLMVAAFMGSERQAALLINAGANANSRDARGYGPLHWAALKGYSGVVDLLLRKRALVNAKSDKGITPLLQAASCGHVEVVRLLLNNRAGVNEPDHEGWTPLHKAVANGHGAVVEELLRSEADVNAAHVSGETPISIAHKRKRHNILELLKGIRQRADAG